MTIGPVTGYPMGLVFAGKFMQARRGHTYNAGSNRGVELSVVRHIRSVFSRNGSLKAKIKATNEAGGILHLAHFGGLTIFASEGALENISHCCPPGGAYRRLPVSHLLVTLSCHAQ